MANITHNVTLAKELNDDIHLFYPRTDSSIVEYNSSNVKSTLDTINTSITNANTKIDNLDTYNANNIKLKNITNSLLKYNMIESFVPGTLTLNGVLADDQNYNVSNYIDVSGLTTFTILYATAITIAFYTKDKLNINTISNITPGTIINISNYDGEMNSENKTRYIRIVVSNGSANYACIFGGEAYLTPSANYKISNSLYSDSINTLNEVYDKTINECNELRMLLEPIHRNILTKDIFILNTSITNSGSMLKHTSFTNKACTKPIKLEEEGTTSLYILNNNSIAYNTYYYKLLNNGTLEYLSSTASPQATHIILSFTFDDSNYNDIYTYLCSNEFMLYYSNTSNNICVKYLNPIEYNTSNILSFNNSTKHPIYEPISFKNKKVLYIGGKSSSGIGLSTYSEDPNSTFSFNGELFSDNNHQILGDPDKFSYIRNTDNNCFVNMLGNTITTYYSTSEFTNNTINDEEMIFRNVKAILTSNQNLLETIDILIVNAWLDTEYSKSIDISYFNEVVRLCKYSGIELIITSPIMHNDNINVAKAIEEIRDLCYTYRVKYCDIYGEVQKYYMDHKTNRSGSNTIGSFDGNGNPDADYHRVLYTAFCHALNLPPLNSYANPISLNHFSTDEKREIVSYINEVVGELNTSLENTLNGTGG